MKANTEYTPAHKEPDISLAATADTRAFANRVKHNKKHNKVETPAEDESIHAKGKTLKCFWFSS